MRILNSIGKPKETPDPILTDPVLPLADDTGFEPLVSSSPQPPPASIPAPCPTCDSPFFWEDITRHIHCQRCTPIPAVRMVRDFWVLDATDQPGGTWADFRWVHRDPFAEAARWGQRSAVFAHLEKEQELATQQVKAADVF